MEEKKLPSGLYIIATPIGNIGDITLRAIDILSRVDVVACEDTRETGKLFSFHGIKADKMPYHDHNADAMRPQILDRIRQGASIALVSDAGMPLVSDPGYKLVSEAAAQGLYVTCVPGASASLNALVLSGLPSDKFMFVGFLPPKTNPRKAALSAVKSVPATLIFYETAPRLIESLEDMHSILGDRPAAVARELTKKFEEVRRDSLLALLSHYQEAGAPKGEIVIVVAGHDEGSAENWGDDDIDALLEKLLGDEGLSVKDASAFAAAKSGRKKSDVYQRALMLKNKK